MVKSRCYTRDEVKAEVRRRWREVIPYITTEAKKKVNGEISWVCPVCKQHGKGGDGLARNPKSKDGVGLKCFGCGWSGDIIDLFIQANGLDPVSDFGYALDSMATQLRIPIAPLSPAQPLGWNDSVHERAQAPQSHVSAADGTESAQHAKSLTSAAQGATEPNSAASAAERKNDSAAEPCAIQSAADYTDYYAACARLLQDNPDGAGARYLIGRGISLATAAAYNIGFDPAADPANAPGAAPGAAGGGKLHPAPRIIIPVTAAHYVGRSTDPSCAAQFRKLDNKGCTKGLFNAAALYSGGSAARPVFVVEGVFDALSILEVGGAAVALNSTSGAAQLVDMLKQRPSKVPLLLCLDNDAAGGGAYKRLAEDLKRIDAQAMSAAALLGSNKDANDALRADRAAFAAAVKREESHILRPDSAAYFIENCMQDEIRRFQREVRSGFKNLDSRYGGFYPGLYAIPAITGLGKTTFAVQLCDQMAAQGNDCIYFSLEQGRLELITKSFARIAAQHDPKSTVTSVSIRKGYAPQIVKDAINEYQTTIADRVNFVEGNFSCDISYIGSYIRDYIRRTGARPVVFVDYMQILQPAPEQQKKTVREAMDSAVTELRRIVRELDLVVFILSSVGRASYYKRLDVDGLKESGGLEYTCDTIFGMQLAACRESTFDSEGKLEARKALIDKASAADPRHIELKCLKSRTSSKGWSVYFEYRPAQDLFIPVPGRTLHARVAAEAAAGTAAGDAWESACDADGFSPVAEDTLPADWTDGGADGCHSKAKPTAKGKAAAKAARKI